MYTISCDYKYTHIYIYIYTHLLLHLLIYQRINLCM